MFHIVEGSTRGLPDVERFIHLIGSPDGHSLPLMRGFFAADRPITVARAPGRLDVMGGIADYSGALVLEMPIHEATLAAVQLDDSRRLRIVSLGARDPERSLDFEMPLSDFETQGGPISFEQARRYFQRDPRRHWAAYVAGAFLVLMRERGMRFAGGARILIDSSVPEGKAVSSSAALEVAVMQAVLGACGVGADRCPPREMALLCQRVENCVVGAPCGVMDQMTAVCGRADQLMGLLCQPAEVVDSIPVPDDLAFWGIDSGVRHAVGGSAYTRVRIGAFMGYRIIAELAKLRVHSGPSGGVVRIDDSVWHGYLANIPPDVFDAQYARQLPEHIRGADFLARYGGTTDPVTAVEPEGVYAVRTPTAHPIHEHVRVRRFAELLRAEGEPHRLESLGQLMYDSHASYSACGLGSAATDRLVELVREAGVSSGLLGAKITGGGSGGTVAVLGLRDAQEAIASVARRYAALTGHLPQVFSGCSPGAAEFGTIVLQA